MRTTRLAWSFQLAPISTYEMKTFTAYRCNAGCWCVLTMALELTVAPQVKNVTPYDDQVAANFVLYCFE